MAFNITKNFIVTNARQVPYVSSATPTITDPFFSSVSLLTQNSSTKTGTILDSSTNNYSMTLGGTAAQGSVTPFTGSGGSLYTGTVAGTGAGSGYISTANATIFNFGTAEFTIEFWIKFSNVNTDQLVFDSRPVSTQGFYPCMYLASTDSKLRWYINGGTGASITSSTACVANTWYHVAISRPSTTTTVYLNGVSVGSSADSTTYISSNPVVIGAQSYSFGINNTNGYISNFRLVKGSAVYTSNFTPPTAPLVGGGIAALLLNFENAKFFDARRLNNLYLGGTAAYSSLSPYVAGSGSLNTTGATSGNGNGTGYLRALSNNVFNFGTSNFTVEYWYFLNNIQVVDHGLVDGRPSGVNGSYFTMYKNSTPNKLFSIFNGAIFLQSSGAPAANTWYHVAVTRNGTSGRLFINGSLDASATDTINYASSDTVVAAFSGNSGPMNGYMTDVRVTKGVCRYTASFTLPTGSFPTS